MTTFGVTPTGFVKKPLTQILQDVGDAQRAVFGAAFDTSTATPQGQLNGTFSSALSECWELLEACYHSFDPDAAADYLLTVLAGLTGTARRPAAPSTVTLTLALNAGATVNAGALVAHAGRPDIVFQTLATVTNSGGSPGAFPVAAQCIVTGAVPSIAGTLTVIVNAVSGWTAVTNAADAVLGRDIDNDILLRHRREQQLALRGGSTAAAIKADLLDITTDSSLANMRNVSVVENTLDTPDPLTGLPGHSIEVLIDDGDTPSVANTLIAQIIFDGKAAGIATFGSSSGVATDLNGQTHTVLFSRTTLRPVYITLSVTTTASYPVDGAAQVKAAIVAAGAGYSIGDLVIALHLRAAALTIAGVVDVQAFALDFAPAPVATGNLNPGLRARATFSSTNISIV